MQTPFLVTKHQTPRLGMEKKFGEFEFNLKCKKKVGKSERDGTKGEL